MYNNVSLRIQVLTYSGSIFLLYCKQLFQTRTFQMIRKIE